jgi:hypothetical protein
LFYLPILGVQQILPQTVGIHITGFSSEVYWKAVRIKLVLVLVTDKFFSCGRSPDYEIACFYIRSSMKDCGEDLLVDISEILFNELAFYKLMQELDGYDICIIYVQSYF